MIYYLEMLHSETIYFIAKSNFYGPNLPPPIKFPNFLLRS